MAETLIEITETTVTHDETAGLQNSVATPAPPGDADDDDVLFSTIPTEFSSRLTALSAPMTAIGAAESDGDVVTFHPTGDLGNIALTDAGGALFNGLDSGLDTTDGQDILLYTDTENDNIVLGRAGEDGPIVFAIYLEETGGPPSTGAKLWTVQYEAIDHGDDGNDHDSAVDLTDKVHVTAFETEEFSLADAPAGDNLFMAFGDAQKAIIFTGRDPANESDGENVSSGDTVNSSGATSTTVGTNGQSVGAGDGMYVTYVTGANADYLAGPGAGNNPGQPLSPTEAKEEQFIQFSSAIGSSGAEFLVSQVNPTKTMGNPTQVMIRITAYDSTPTQGNMFVDTLTNGNPVDILSVTIDGSPVAFTPDGDGVIVMAGVDDLVGFTTDGAHTQVLIENAQPTVGAGKNISFDIGGFNLTDTAADTDEIGSKVFFEDDGPTIDLTLGAGALQTDDGALSGGNAGGTTTDTEGVGSLFSVTSSTGADNVNDTDDIAYSLAVGANAATLLVDTATGETVTVSLNGGVIEGRTTGTDDLVFTVSVDNSSGAVTLEQLRAVQHATDDTAAPYDGDVTGLGVADAIRLVGTISDDETAADTAEDSIDISANISFTDDGPTIDLTLGGGELQTDDGALSGGNAGGTTTDTEGVGSLFSVTSSTGADNVNDTDDIAYSLAVGANAATLLVDTATGETVTVSLNGGVIEGRTTGTDDLVFTVSVDNSSGAVTLEQLRAVQHATDDTAAPYDGDVTGLGVADAIRLVGTISDDETAADTAEDSIDISGNISFTDDGPTIDLTLGGGELQTDDGALSGGNAGGTTTDTEGVGSLFSVTSSTGADNVNDTDDIAYSLAVGANAATLLVDTATGETVTVSLNGGVIEGRTTGTDDLVFTVSVDNSSGAVTLEQLRAVQHATDDTAAPYDGDVTGLGVADAIRLVGTISDDETAADTAEDSIDISGNISFTDDGPTIDLTLGGGELQTDDGALSGGNAGGTTTDTEGVGSLFSVVSSTGADTKNDGDDIAYGLAVGANAATLLVDTATGETVTVSLNGGVIEGRTTGTDDLVFTVSVDNSSGAVTLEQLRAVQHATDDTAAPYDGDVTGLGVADAIRLVGTISDDEPMADADTASDSIDISANISFTDDGPTIDLTLGGGELQTDDGALSGGNAGGTTTDTEGVGSLFSVVSSTGADTKNDGDDIAYSLAVGANAATALVDTATGETVTVSLNGGVIEGRTTGTDDLVFTVSVDNSSGAVTLEQLRAVQHATDDTAAPYDGDVTGLGVADAIRLVGTISDDETAADTAEDSIDISANISFTDDGPTIDLTLGGGELQTDDGALSGGNAGGTTTDTEGVGSLFSVVSSTGADTKNDGDDIAYSLAVGANAATALVDTATGETVTVSLNGGVIEGRTTGTDDLVFTVSVDNSSGAVTLEQLRAVQHATDDTAAPYDGDVTGLGVADAIRLVGTISDDETAADTAEDSIDISGNISFTDDGPTIDLTLGGGELQTDDGALSGGNAGGTTTDTEGVGSLFSVTSSTGADNVNDTDDIAYSLAVGANAATLLVDTATGETVTVSLNGGVIEGRTTGTDDLVFTVSVDNSSGAVTLEQLRAVQHATDDTAAPYDGDVTGLGVADAIRLVGTISDDETAADTAEDSIDISGNISFTDDGPTIDLTLGGGELQTDDGALSGGNAGGTTTDTEGVGSLFSVTSSTGADNVNDTDEIAYSLAVGANAATLLVDTATGETVTVSLNGGVIEGRTTGTDDLVFTVSVDNSSGAVTLEQLRAVQHATDDTAAPYDGDVTGLGVADAIRLVGTISDDEPMADADTASDSIDISGNISFTDDGPTLTVADSSGDYGAGAQGIWSDLPGADGFKSLSVTLDSYTVGISLVDPDPNISLTATDDYAFAGSLTADFTDDNVANPQTLDFTLTFDPDADTYDFQIEEPDGTTVEFDTSQGTLKAGGPDAVRTLLFGGTPPTEAGDDDIVFFAAKATAPQVDADENNFDSILDLIERGPDDLTEGDIEGLGPLPNLVAAAQMNVSTAGIGVDSNNLTGADEGQGTGVFAGTTITANDNSFVVNPETVVDKVTVYISSTTGGYAPDDPNHPEELYYTTYYTDGTFDGPELVESGDLTGIAKNDMSFIKEVRGGDFFVIDGGDKQIDAVQLTMGLGQVKIPLIGFTVEEAFDPQALEMDFTAELFDGDEDSATDTFSIDLVEATV